MALYSVVKDPELGVSVDNINSTTRPVVKDPLTSDPIAAMALLLGAYVVAAVDAGVELFLTMYMLVPSNPPNTIFRAEVLSALPPETSVFVTVLAYLFL